jgi:hypothetical protein
MNVRHVARVIHVNDLIEEQVFLEIEGQELVCFITSCPYRLDTGVLYPIAIALWSMDDIVLEEVLDQDAESCLKRIGDTFKYCVVGRLRAGGILDAGVRFQDDQFVSEFPDLVDKVVEAQVDRIGVEFLQPDSLQSAPG